MLAPYEGKNGSVWSGQQLEVAGNCLASNESRPVAISFFAYVALWLISPIVWFEYIHNIKSEKNQERNTGNR